MLKAVVNFTAYFLKKQKVSQYKRVSYGVHSVAKLNNNSTILTEPVFISRKQYHLLC